MTCLEAHFCVTFDVSWRSYTLSHKGYALEHILENLLLEVGEQKRETPIWDRSRRNPSSGAMRGLKADVVSNIPWLKPDWIFECKHYRQSSLKGPSYRFQAKDWWDLERDARSYHVDAVPVFVFCFKGQKQAIYAVFKLDSLEQFRKKTGIAYSCAGMYLQSTRGAKPHFSLAHNELRKDLGTSPTNYARLVSGTEELPDLACVRLPVMKHLLLILKELRA